MQVAAAIQAPTLRIIPPIGPIAFSAATVKGEASIPNCSQGTIPATTNISIVYRTRNVTLDATNPLPRSLGSLHSAPHVVNVTAPIYAYVPIGIAAKKPSQPFGIIGVKLDTSIFVHPITAKPAIITIKTTTNAN